MVIVKLFFLSFSQKMLTVKTRLKPSLKNEIIGCLLMTQNSMKKYGVFKEKQLIYYLTSY